MYQDILQLKTLVERLEASAKNETMANGELLLLGVVSLQLHQTVAGLLSRSKAAEARLQATMATTQWENEYLRPIYGRPDRSSS
jgi:hypothetical protein